MDTTNACALLLKAFKLSKILIPIAMGNFPTTRDAIIATRPMTSRLHDVPSIVFTTDCDVTIYRARGLVNSFKFHFQSSQN